MKYTFLIAVLITLGIAILIITFSNFRLTNEQYDRLKAVVLKWPGIMTFLGVLVSVFGFEFGEETITLVAAIGAFMSYCLGISSRNYSDGAYDSGARMEDYDEDEDIPTV